LGYCGPKIFQDDDKLNLACPHRGGILIDATGDFAVSRQHCGAGRFPKGYAGHRFWAALPSIGCATVRASAGTGFPVQSSTLLACRCYTPGGTERRARLRAKLKAQHRAERAARWKAEKATRVQSRVHKPQLTKLRMATELNSAEGQGGEGGKEGQSS
jgi:hypothetical protein